MDDLRMPRKQRHTAKRVYERLVAECGYEGAHPSVQRWVKRWREKHRAEGEGFAELSWHPGVAQVDFGQAHAVLAPRERTVHSLVVSFPYSNMRCVVACPGEDAACVCHGPSRVFSHVDMAPRILVFDNTPTWGNTTTKVFLTPSMTVVEDQMDQGFKNEIDKQLYMLGNAD